MGRGPLAALLLAGLAAAALVADSFSRSLSSSVLLSRAVGGGGLGGEVVAVRRGWRPSGSRAMAMALARRRQQLATDPGEPLQQESGQGDIEEDAILHDDLMDDHADYAPSSGRLLSGYGYQYKGGMPPEEWPHNWDGENFIDHTRILGYTAGAPYANGDYWLAATGEDPPDWVPEDEETSNIFADLRWNDGVWCNAEMCDYTNQDTTEPVSGDFQPGALYNPI